MPFGHAQNIVQADFFVPAFHEEGVGVEQKNHGKEPNNHSAQIHDGGDGCPAGHVFQLLMKGEEGHVVKHGHGNQAGEQVRKLEAAVAHQVACGHFGEKEFTHGLHPLWPGRSACPQSG